MEPESLESRIQEVIQEYNLTEENIAVSYQNTVTNETYAYNDTIYLFAASTYKLPLNMYYYMMINDGQISPSAYVAAMFYQKHKNFPYFFLIMILPWL